MKSGIIFVVSFFILACAPASQLVVQASMCSALHRLLVDCFIEPFCEVHGRSKSCQSRMCFAISGRGTENRHVLSNVTV